MLWYGLLIVAAVMAIGLFLVGLIDGNRFVVVENHFKLPNLAKSCKFIMISDLHNKVYGEKNQKLIDAIKQVNPEFIVIAGDLITAHEKESIDVGVQLINTLSKDYKIYYGLGNHETKMKTRMERFGAKYDKLIKGIEHSNVTVLANETCMLPEYNINLVGVELAMTYFARFKKAPMASNYLEEHLGKAKQDSCNVLLAHNPIYFEEYAAWGADLVLSGHVHGGIMRLPVLGGVISPSYTLFPKYDGGIFHEQDATMLLGRGMGAHTIPFRFFNPAELHVVYCETK